MALRAKGKSVVVAGPNGRPVMLTPSGRGVVSFTASRSGKWSYEWDTGDAGVFDVRPTAASDAPAGVVEPG